MGEAQKVDQSRLSCPEIEGNNVMRNLMKIWLWKLSNFFYIFFGGFVITAYGRVILHKLH